MPRTKDENLTNLGDFFSLIAGEKKKKEEEYKSLLGDLNSVLTELDKVSKTSNKKEKKKIDTAPKKENKIEEKKIENPKVDINGLFEELAALKKKEEEKKKKETKEIKAFENWLFKEPIEVVDQVIKEEEEYSKPLIETPLVEYELPVEITFDEEVDENNEEDHTEVSRLEEEPEVKEESVEDEVEETPEQNATVSQVLETLKSIIKDENLVEEKNNEIESLKKEVRDLRNLLYQGLRDIAAQGGGGEVRLEFLDDIDRNSAKIDNRFLKYDATSGKFVGAAAGAGSQTLNDTLGLGNTSNLGMSVGVVTATSFVGDGSQLTGIVASSGIGIQTAGGFVGTATTISFEEGFSVSFSDGLATIDNDLDLGTFT